MLKFKTHKTSLPDHQTIWFLTNSCFVSSNM